MPINVDTERRPGVEVLRLQHVHLAISNSLPWIHFVASKVHVLSDDICSLSRNSKEKFDVLGDLESRVQKLRYTNMHGSSSRPWADRQVDSCMIFTGDACFVHWCGKGHVGRFEQPRENARNPPHHHTCSTYMMFLQVDVDLKVDLSRPNTMLFKVCSKCNARVLKKVLDVHERFCYGAADRWARLSWDLQVTAS